MPLTEDARLETRPHDSAEPIADGAHHNEPRDPEWSTILEVARQAWNEVNPFHCNSGEDCNPDEYIGYARRFVEGLRGAYPALSEEPSKNSPFLIEELVRRSFYAGQTCYHPGIERCWATRRDRAKIASLLRERLRTELELLGFPA